MASVGAAAAVWLSGVRPTVALGIAAAVTFVLPIVGSTFDSITIVLVFVGFQAAANSNLNTGVLAAMVFVALTVNDIWLRVAFDDALLDTSIVYPAIWTALAVGLGVQSRKVRLQHERLLALNDADRRRRCRRSVVELPVTCTTSPPTICRHWSCATSLPSDSTITNELRHAADFTADTAADTLDAIRQSSRCSAPRIRHPCHRSVVITERRYRVQSTDQNSGSRSSSAVHRSSTCSRWCEGLVTVRHVRRAAMSQWRCPLSLTL